ncbi:hypothetical protein K438DRAFT_1590239 [Mycena galopus ATCC 62051]|nr:hypothetical protein K438DRAFT_1590239 [Mycena galopus ATCC 62051]
MNLEETQRQNLHDFVAVSTSLQWLRQYSNSRPFQLGSAGKGLSQADLATRLYALAVQFSDIAERRRIAASEEPTDFKALWRDLKIRLDGNFCFTKDQEKNIRGVVRDLIIDPSRTVYTTMHIDVMAHIKKHIESLSLANVMGVPAREQALSSQVRSAGSSVRNAFRKEIIVSIAPKTWVPLAQFTYDILKKYKNGGAPLEVPQSHTAHMAILVGFLEKLLP